MRNSGVEPLKTVRIDWTINDEARKALTGQGYWSQANRNGYFRQL
jgi:hypothetical protein